MGLSGPYPAETRQAVEALLQDPALTMCEIAECSGISYGTVRHWRREARIRPWMSAVKVQSDPAKWSVRRMQAVARLFRRGDIDPGDIAEALGSRRSDADAMALACGGATTRRPVLGPPGDAPDLATLDAALRAHIARQIAAFDDVLSRSDAATDTAKVLRDLGGLKRLLDDLGTPARQPESNGDADGGSPQDLATLRADLARRYEAFEASRDGTGVPGEPAGGPSPGADP